MDYKLPELEYAKDLVDDFLVEADNFIERQYERAEQIRDELREDGIAV